jgi:O-antigen/teichoic acid export membrane protein
VSGDPTGPSDTLEAVEVLEAGDVLDASTAGNLAARGGAIRIVSFLAGTLSGAGAAALLYRHLGTTAVGQYGLILALIGIVGGFSDLGLTVVGTRAAATLDPEGRTTMLRDLLGLRVAMTVIGIVAIAAICIPLYGSLIVWGVLLGGVGLVLQVWLDNYIVSLIVTLRLGWVAIIDFGRNFSSAVLIVALVAISAHLLSFVAVTIPIGVVALCGGVRLLRDERSLLPTFNAARWRGLLASSFVYSLAAAAATLYFYAAIVLTSLLSSAHQLGYYQLTFRVTSLLTIVPWLLSSSALPIFSRAARDDSQRLGYALNRVLEVSLLLGVWVALTLAIGARLAVELIGGTTGHHNFLPAVPVLVIQAVALAGTFVSCVGQHGLLSLGLHRRILVINLSGLFVAIVLMCLLIPAYGARGAAIATMIGELSAGFTSWLALCTARPELRPSLRMVPGIAAAAAAGCAPLLIGSLPVIVRIVLSSALYFAVVLLTRSYPHEIAAMLPVRLRPLLRGR